MTKPNVLVTETEYNKAAELFANCDFANITPAPTDEKPLAEAVLAQNARAVILGVANYQGPLYNALAKVNGDTPSLIARFGVGHDGVDKQLAKEKNIYVTNTPGVLDVSVAEHAMWLVGAVARNVAKAHMAMKNGQFPSFVGTELLGKTLAIIGLGPIGQRVARIASQGFGMRVIAMDVIPPAELPIRLGMAELDLKVNLGLAEYTTDFAAAVAEADIVSLHIPANAKTRHFINASTLDKFKPGAWLINTARGLVVDESGLYDALCSGRIAAAGLDVFENEPYTPANADKDLRTLDNVVLTSHIGSSTYQANERMAKACLNNLKSLLDNQPADMTQVS